MLNFNRNDSFVEVKDPARAATAGRTETPQQPAGGAGPAARPLTSPVAVAREAVAEGSAPPILETPAPAVPPRTETAASKLFVGVNIRLKGVEISNCDVLVVEGHVEATVNSKAMEISQPGTLTGTAVIDVAEIHGEFSGELTARTKLVVHGTGRVTGTIRYGKLVVAEGGMLTGELRQLDAAAPEGRPAPAQEGRSAPAHAGDKRAARESQHAR
jgi:cytoskeletal protein CcmA (bactofilin family)